MINNPFGNVKLKETPAVEFKQIVIPKTENKIVEVPKKLNTELSGRARVLKQYNNIESDIPVNHPYWRMKG